MKQKTCFKQVIKEILWGRIRLILLIIRFKTVKTKTNKQSKVGDLSVSGHQEVIQMLLFRLQKEVGSTLMVEQVNLKVQFCHLNNKAHFLTLFDQKIRHMNPLNPLIQNFQIMIQLLFNYKKRIIINLILIQSRDSRWCNKIIHFRVQIHLMSNRSKIRFKAIKKNNKKISN